MACVALWDAEDVALWVEMCLQLPYGAAFRLAGIAGQRLLDLNEERLRGLGVLDGGHQQRLLSHVAGFRQQVGERDAPPGDGSGEAASEPRAASRPRSRGRSGGEGAARGSTEEAVQGFPRMMLVPEPSRRRGSEEREPSTRRARSADPSSRPSLTAHTPSHSSRPARKEVAPSLRPEPSCGSPAPAFWGSGEQKVIQPVLWGLKAGAGAAGVPPVQRRTSRGAVPERLGTGCLLVGSGACGSAATTCSTGASGTYSASPLDSAEAWPEDSAPEEDGGESSSTLRHRSSGSFAGTGMPSSSRSTSRAGSLSRLTLPERAHRLSQADSEFGRDRRRGASFSSSTRTSAARSSPGPGSYSAKLPQSAGGPRFSETRRQTLDGMHTRGMASPGVAAYFPVPQRTAKGGKLGSAARWQSESAVARPQRERSPGPQRYTPRYHCLSNFK